MPARRLLRGLLCEIDQLDWNELDATLPRVATLLQELADNPRLLVDEVDHWRSPDLQARAELCHETSTHYKWFVAKSERHGFFVWIHQYKPGFLQRAGHALVAHNHRYGFASCVLKGSFTHVHFNVKNTGPGSTDWQIEEAETEQVEAGTTYYMGPSSVHALREIADGTVTVVVQSRAVREYSRVWDLESGVYTQYPDFRGLLGSLEAELAPLRVGAARPIAGSANAPVPPSRLTLRDHFEQEADERRSCREQETHLRDPTE